jgi:phosphatidylglycerophosphate synthase
MRKITCNCENPLDNILINISDYMCPYAKKYGFTPNILTTVSLIFCGIAALLLLNSFYYLAAFMYLISYYFDCMDGHFARKYKMVTKFGDYYDHFADTIKVILILYILYKSPNFINPVVLFNLIYFVYNSSPDFA